MGGQFDDSSIKSFFIIEAQEYIDTLKEASTALSFNPDDISAKEKIQKTAHTLKGSSAMLSFNELSKMARYAELIMKALAARALSDEIDVNKLLKDTIRLMELMVINISGNHEEENEEILRENRPKYDNILSQFEDEDSSITKPKKEDEEDDDFDLEEDREDDDFDLEEDEEDKEVVKEEEEIIARTSTSVFKQVDENLIAQETFSHGEEDELLEAHEKIDLEQPSKSYYGIPTLSGESKKKMTGTSRPPVIEEKEPIQETELIQEEPKIELELEDVQYKSTQSIEYKKEEPPEPKIPAEPKRAPKQSDFFVPSSETTPLQAKKKPDRGMSFLDMIPDIKESFMLEATDHIQNIDHMLLDWESDSKNKELTQELMRSAHSLKGSANTVGFPEMGIIAHRMEDIIETVQEGKLEVTLELVDTLFEALDVMKVLLRWIDGEEHDANSLAERAVAKLEKVMSQAPSEEEAEEEIPEEAVEPDATIDLAAQQQPIPPSYPERLDIAPEEMTQQISIRDIIPDAERSITGPQPAQKSPVITDEYETYGYTPTGAFQALQDDDLVKPDSRLSRISIGETEKQTVRVHINQLDLLMNLIGELVINRARLDKRTNIFKDVGEELDFSRRRLIEAVEEFTEKHEFTLPEITPGDEDAGIDDFSALEFDKYDDFNILSRSLMEIGSDVVEIMNEITDFLRSFDTEIKDIASIITRLQEEITRTRMVPIGRLFRRFSRTVRDISNRENKNVQLMIMGEDTELDKTVIEEMSDPLMHLVRNAVSHGLESPQERVNMGKNKQGTVLLNAYPQGNTIILEVEDDGKGLDLVKIKESAISKGLLTDEAAETITQNQLIDYIFTPGFTTTESTTEISGRGVGLDVVRENILHLGGTISVQTEKNIGTRFIIKLPLTLAITQALLIESAGVPFALPLNAVEETVVLDTHKLGNIQDTEVIEIRNKSVPFLKLHEILHLPSQMNGRRFMPVVLLGSAGANAALLVDDLVGQEEIVVKQLGDFMEKVRYFSGATISGEGNVVLILDPTYIVGFDEFAISSTSTMESTLKERIEVEKEALEQAEDKKHRLLLVDDSISIRKFVGKLLENAGYNVDVAIDGLEALSKVEGTYYNLIITDLEMPRMHGYEFISELKNNDRYKNIPVIVLTSRAGEKHKQKAMSKGADGYIVKPFNEEILLENISRFL